MCIRDRPIPEIPQGKVEVRIPKDIAYINSLTARLPEQDVTEEEADNIYLLLKAYQAVRVIALDSGRYSQEEMEKAVKPGPVSYTHLDVYKRQITPRCLLM